MTIPRQCIGVLGGTFDPVHFGHLRFAIEFRDMLGARHGSCVHIVPCHMPPHHKQPAASAEQRLAMLKLAVDGRCGFCIDTRELDSQQPSFSIETLLSLRNEFPDAVLVLAIGMDSFAGFRHWHRWQDILQIAALLVSTRPGTCPGRDSDWMRSRQVDLQALTAPGQIAVLEMTPLAISSSLIRAMIKAGQCVDFLLPDKVVNYIALNNLYRC